MAKSRCSVVVDGYPCGDPVSAKGMCGRHYMRWKRHGDPLAGSLPRIFNNDERRFWSKVLLLPNGCGEWRGTINDHGYGEFSFKGRNLKAHIWAYERYIGPVPPGMELDHICHTNDPSCTDGDDCPHRRCPLPYHLEPVTHAENMKRGRMGEHMKGLTHCRKGHPFDEANTHVRADGTRVCRKCASERERERRRRRDAA